MVNDTTMLLISDTDFILPVNIQQKIPDRRHHKEESVVFKRVFVCLRSQTALCDGRIKNTMEKQAICFGKLWLIVSLSEL